jgi:general stress protein 26
MADTHTTNDTEKLVELLEGIRFAMFTTRSEGRLHARPMATIDADTSGSLYFFVDRTTDLFDEIDVDPAVGLTYSDNDGARYVSVSGTASKRDDRARVEDLWNPILKAWFDGPDDPKLQLVEVRIDTAEYWDGEGNRLVRLVGIVKAAVTGDEYDAGEQGEISLDDGRARQTSPATTSR